MPRKPRKIAYADLEKYAEHLSDVLRAYTGLVRVLKPNPGWYFIKSPRALSAWLIRIEADNPPIECPC